MHGTKRSRRRGRRIKRTKDSYILTLIRCTWKDVRPGDLLSTFTTKNNVVISNLVEDGSLHRSITFLTSVGIWRMLVNSDIVCPYVISRIIDSYSKEEAGLF